MNSNQATPQQASGGQSQLAQCSCDSVLRTRGSHNKRSKCGEDEFDTKLQATDTIFAEDETRDVDRGELTSSAATMTHPLSGEGLFCTYNIPNPLIFDKNYGQEPDSSDPSPPGGWPTPAPDLPDPPSPLPPGGWPDNETGTGAYTDEKSTFGPPKVQL